MRLAKLCLEHFRNHQKLQLEFDPANLVTYIVGPNAQGKTNILEAIYLLALTKSFRTTHHEDLIGWNQEYARVKGFFEIEVTTQKAASRPESYCDLEVFLGLAPHSRKSLKKNGATTSTMNFIGTLQVVFFHPEDLNMLYLGPDLRRRYLDILNLQINKKYFRALQVYQRVLKQRNALLKRIHGGQAADSELEIWDEQLTLHGAFLMLERAKTVDFFRDRLEEYYQKISQGSEKIKVHYRHTLGDAALMNTPALTDHAVLQSIYKKTLNTAKTRDIQAQMTTVGPHRDDLEFLLNDFRLSAHASRGEYRSLILALKLLELHFFEERTAQKPLLLLDDVFSELDAHRQKMLLQAIKGHQTFITTTNAGSGDFLKDRVHTGLELAVIAHGKITENMLK